ncbi:response regulator [bacterium]|nr:response regulator [bacterium]
MSETRAGKTPKGSVLVVDDERNMCRILNKVLSDEGYRVHCVHTAEDALAWLPGNHADIVLTDLHHGRHGRLGPPGAGPSHQPETCVIVATAYSTVENAVQAMKAGAATTSRSH